MFGLAVETSVVLFARGTVERNKVTDMKLTELQANLRSGLIDQLHTLSSAEEQLQYQRNVPFVNVTVELICGWFDDRYGPENRDFVAAFSTPELIAMARFNKIFDDVLNSASLREEAPEIEDLLKRPE